MAARRARRSADASQLCRAGANLVLSPIDVLLGPFIAGKDEYYGLTEIDDPTALKVVGAVPGYVLLLGLQIGGSIFREIAGVVRDHPRRRDPVPRGARSRRCYRSAEDAWALYSEDYGPCPVHVGVSYNTINDG